MKKLMRLLLVCLTGVLLMSAHADESIVSQSSQSAQSESRSILVTYVDRSINRRSVLSSGRHYRARGQYKSSVWSQRVARKLSDTHDLILLSQWPVTQLGVHCAVYQVPGDASLDLAMEDLRRESVVDSVQPMNHFHTMAKAYSDPYYQLQDNIHAMQVGAVQLLTTGANVKIAVIDTGIDRKHIDLDGQIFTHQEFMPAQQGGSSSKSGSQKHSYDVHGTAVAGVIGAIANNNTGIVGVSPDAKLIALKACRASRDRSLSADCTSFTLAKALNTAIMMKPDIINMSLGGPPDPLLQRLIDYALDQGIIVIAAASPRADGSDSFPASMDRVLGVSDVQTGDTMRMGEKVLLAPGQDVLTTIPDNTYEYISGSSISAAAVSGIVALLLELNPQLSQQHIEALLESSARRNLPDTPMMVNACHAVAALYAESSSVKESRRGKKLVCASAVY